MTAVRWTLGPVRGAVGEYSAILRDTTFVGAELWLLLRRGLPGDGDLARARSPTRG